MNKHISIYWNNFFSKLLLIQMHFSMKYISWIFVIHLSSSFQDALSVRKGIIILSCSHQSLRKKADKWITYMHVSIQHSSNTIDYFIQRKLVRFLFLTKTWLFHQKWYIFGLHINFETWKYRLWPKITISGQNNPVGLS